jgi:hypothetical protein
MVCSVAAGAIDSRSRRGAKVKREDAPNAHDGDAGYTANARRAAA